MRIITSGLVFVLVSVFFSASSFAMSPELNPQLKLHPQASFWNGVKDFFGAGTHPSSWSDVKNWKPLGRRFAGAYDGNGTLIAVYDLSYPNFQNPISIGTISRTSQDSSVLLTRFNLAAQNLNESELGSDVKAKIAALGAIPTAVANAAVLGEGWWKALPWKLKTLRQAEPDFFRLTDLEQADLKIGAPLIQGLRNLFQIVLEDTGALNGLADEEILNSFQFVREPNGGFKLQWNDPRGIANPLRPRKLLDFANTHQGFYDHIKLEAISAGLSEAITLIPVPVVEALLATAVSRVARYARLTETEHLEMLHELAIESSESSLQDAVLDAMSATDQNKLTSAFEWSRVTPIDVWKWIFQNPDKNWAKDANSTRACATQTRQWLQDQGEVLTHLNDRFEVGVSLQSEKALYLEADVCARGNREPTVSIDYSSPKSVARERFVTEWVGVSLEFDLTSFRPLALRSIRFTTS